MKQAFEVIVMQDVKEPEERRPRPRNVHGGAVVSAADIEREMAMEGRDPTQDEVNESINALRPETTLLDGEQYKELAKSLTEGFTTDQLHAFFTQSLNLSAVEGDTVHLLRQQPSELQTRYRRTQWRPGRTRLEKRLPLGTVVKKSEKTNKPKLVEQILRLTWDLAIHAEEQQVGELELKLESWEMTYLFDLQPHSSFGKSRVMYQKLVKSPFLLRACEIRPYRPNGFLRISGRRQDAEEVATRLEKSLPEIGHLTVKLDAFTPLLNTPGWPSTLAHIFRRDDINYVQERTFTVIEQPRPDTLHIYSNAIGQRMEARRLLYALLELPTVGSTVLVQNSRLKASKTAVHLPEAPGTAVHFRHQKLSLTRLTSPTARIVEGHQGGKLDTAEDTLHKSLTRMVQRELAAVTQPALPTHDLNPRSQWSPADTKTSPWKAQLCRILHASSGVAKHGRNKRGKQTSNGSPTSTDPLTVVNAQTHHLETLLSFFVPQQQSKERSTVLLRPHLTARFVPSPFKSHGVKAASTLPSIELAYYFFTNEDGYSDLYLTHAHAILHTQDLRVPLPSEATDLRFTRHSTVLGKRSSLLNDPEVEAFTQMLRKSLQESKSSNLVGRPSVVFHLPAAWVRGKEAADKTPDEKYQYHFTGFEQTQTREFSPVDSSELPAKLDPELKALFASFGERTFLQLREVSAGTLGGKRTEVLLHAGNQVLKEEQKAVERRAENGKKRVVAEGEDDEEGEIVASEDTQERVSSFMVKTALGLARFLTKIGNGEVRPLVRHARQLPGEAGEEEEGPGEDEGDGTGEAECEIEAGRQDE